jgi:CheY-like chemotaxis protein
MPDLVLMDAHMPETDGFTACTRIRGLSAGEHIPVLVITALDEEHTIDRAIAPLAPGLPTISGSP